ncbi:DNA-binding transcriptional ArsR family regulator [Rhizobium leguminosarum]|uniref:DNA-binding transcriptional ArsR family regulator n=1 Tax=Rhizobium leguminosarum TaxID=384 RepID=A0AAE2SUU6_RHILE|nr:MULTISPECIES: helix-turn-helix domain-containing protein [Rhizobium]MBB4288852.1 DNA-binding transcriptional ArsR family regulator [Rhizobium leguminosarum]MBB4295054.1 DNA-binding transcriptional ArsR family regulator [Rhizobium leguminosarum]MBB4306448.1 DNA-binding transcriptional ArsR family regulator [Rhizobium leguminosarum]MBB4417972.1 DNA-binding transcriptional ArsR family regulator [Rhizobium leguminosarum]MBB4432817.1 DNA-binding transcriptional ArsR family regulator [Rhizobium e
MRPLFHPALEDIRPEAILYALSDPERAAIYVRLAGAACGNTCSALAELGDRIIPKSSLSNHFKVLRESGLIVSERQGVEMRNQTRCTELDERFPGLIKAILSAYGQIPGEPKTD